MPTMTFDVPDTLTPAQVETIRQEVATLLQQAAERAEVIQAVNAGLADVDAGRTISLEDYQADVQAARRKRAESANR